MKAAGPDRLRQFAAIVLMSALLLWAAFLNRFPLIFPDTAPYLGAAYANAWPIDRSGFYGLAMLPILKPVGGVAGLWVAVIVQALAIAAVLLFVLRKLAPEAPPIARLAIFAFTAVATSLPWHAGQLMPDAFTGVVVLLTWLAITRDPAAPGAPLLWFAAVAVSVIHLTHIGIMAVTAAAVLLVLIAGGLERRQAWKRLLAATLAVAMVAGIQIAGNGVTLGRWTVSPTGPLFLFARLNEDGLMPHWAERHCGRDAPVELCRLQQAIPRDSQLALWHESSPINPLVWFGDHRWRWIEQMSDANRQAIAEQPLAFAAAAIEGGVDQFAHFAALDDECPMPCADPGEVLVITLAAQQPQILAAFEQSRQYRGEMPRALVRSLVWPVAVAGLLSLLPMLGWLWLRRDWDALALVAGVSAALIANALMAGALSDVHDRYQSRIVWLAPFVVLAVAVRLYCRRGVDGRAART